MRYNTEEKKMPLPEYGRNIQNMVDHCLTITDREECMHCADTIIDIMGNMFPHLRDVNDFKHILWDHLAIMSNFKLNIDYPYDIVKKEDLDARPPHIPYPHNRIHYRHYGHIIEQLIEKVVAMESGDEKDALILMLAMQMKKSLMTWNKESVDDYKVFKDLYELSDGAICIYEDDLELPDFPEIEQQVRSNTTAKSTNKKNNPRKKK